jgi:hypothetical protein
MAGGVEFGERSLHKFLVAGLGGADEIVVGQLEFPGEGLPVGGEGVAVFLRVLLFGLRGLLDLLTVFVQAREEEDFLPEAAARPGDDVRDDFLVGVPDMRLAVDIINGRGDVKTLAHRTNSVWHKRAVGNPAKRGCPRNILPCVGFIPNYVPCIRR